MIASQYHFNTFPFVFNCIQPGYKESRDPDATLLPVGVREESRRVRTAANEVDNLDLRARLDSTIFPIRFSDDLSIELHRHSIGRKPQKRQQFNQTRPLWHRSALSVERDFDGL